MDNNSDRCAIMRQEIMNCIRANNLQVTGELWITLIFRTERELIRICQDLHIAIPKEVKHGNEGPVSRSS